VLVLASGCAATSGSPSDSGETPIVYPGTVDVGGYRMWAQCTGEGSPTIILEPGDESSHAAWSYVAPQLTETRVCMYDRLGLGLSDKPTGCRDLADLNGDLEAVLTALGEHGPYILVGASGGGYLMAGYAMAHPDDVAGILTLDTQPAIDTTNAPATLLHALKCDASNNIERRDYVAVEHAAWDDRHLVGDIPMTVISNDYGDTAGNEEERNSVTAQQGWFVLSPQARQVVVTSGHDIPHFESELTVTEILAVLTAARGE
jgi:pimeloyl-ACP methyl ester carboxylesterase